MIVLNVFAEPVAQPRARASRQGRVYNKPGKVDGWRAQIVAAWKRQGAEPLDGPVAVSIECHLTTPKAGAHADRRDVDNLAKAVLDALSDAGAWRDDRQVVELIVTKESVRDLPGVTVTIQSAE
jgi:Holliday junction resolvase RusA-like endonuclease